MLTSGSSGNMRSWQSILKIEETFTQAAESCHPDAATRGRKGSVLMGSSRDHHAYYLTHGCVCVCVCVHCNYQCINGCQFLSLQIGLQSLKLWWMLLKLRFAVLTDTQLLLRLHINYYQSYKTQWHVHF